MWYKRQLDRRNSSTRRHAGREPGTHLKEGCVVEGNSGRSPSFDTLTATSMVRYPVYGRNPVYSSHCGCATTQAGKRQSAAKERAHASGRRTAIATQGRHGGGGSYPPIRGEGRVVSESGAGLTIIMPKAYTSTALVNLPLGCMASGARCVIVPSACLLK